MLHVTYLLHILYWIKIWIPAYFFNDFLDSISPTHNADLNNTGGREAGSATAAAFLADFVPDNIPYAHFDIAGVGGIFPQDGFHWSILFLRGCLRQIENQPQPDSTFPYLSKGMSGRPTRTLFKIIENYYS